MEWNVVIYWQACNRDRGEPLERERCNLPEIGAEWL